MKRLLSILMILTLLFTAGCALSKPQTPTPDNAPEKTPVDTETETETETEPETETETEIPEKEIDWNGGLVMLRQAMIETPQVMAIAYLGYYGGDEITKCESLCDNHPIFKELTTDMVVGDGYELYCVVAMDENAQISVNRIDESGEVTEVIYKGDGKKPILVAANGAGFSPDTAISLVDKDGTAYTYQFITDDNGRLAKNDAVYDFSSYRDILTVIYNENIEDGWEKATADKIAGTSWDATKYTLDGRTKTYHLDFFESTVNIQWNDGIDEEDHLYTAGWSIDGNDGKIKINLDNLDGERTFIMLLGSDVTLMRLLEDFTNDDTMHEYEALQTLFEKTVG